MCENVRHMAPRCDDERFCTDLGNVKWANVAIRSALTRAQSMQQND